MQYTEKAMTISYPHNVEYENPSIYGKSRNHYVEIMGNIYKVEK